VQFDFTALIEFFRYGSFFKLVQKIKKGAEFMTNFFSFKGSIRKKLISAFVSLIVVSLVLMSLIVYLKVVDQTKKDYIESIKKETTQLNAGVENYISLIKENTNITLSMCHSAADYELAKEAINLGVSNITHMFNAMSSLNHRNPGVVGTALLTDTYCELICDEIHVHKDLFQFVLNNKGKDRIILITDSMRAGCLKSL